MVKYIIRELVEASPNRTVSDVEGQEIDKALTKAFRSLDQDIQDAATTALSGASSLGDIMAQTRPAQAGSCALMAYYHSESQMLKVACTGDSRAILGRRNAAGEWEVIPLSVDQTGSNAGEVARLQSEHPDEPSMVKGGRVLGLMVSRAFGGTYIF